MSLLTSAENQVNLLHFLIILDLGKDHGLGLWIEHQPPIVQVKVINSFKTEVLVI